MLLIRFIQPCPRHKSFLLSGPLIFIFPSVEFCDILATNKEIGVLYIDPAIWSAIITGISSIIICYMGFRWGQQDQSTLSSRKIMHEQLTKFLAPLDLLLSTSDAIDWHVLNTEIKNLVTTNYIFVPPILFEHFKRLERYEPCSPQEYVEFRLVVSSLYNRAKKKLGYPYDKTKIVKEYTPTYEKKSAVVHVISFAVTLFAAILTFVISAVTSIKPELITADPSKNSEFIFIAATLTAVALSFFELIIHRRD